jgi:hypothetical protein
MDGIGDGGAGPLYPWLCPWLCPWLFTAGKAWCVIIGVGPDLMAGDSVCPLEAPLTAAPSKLRGGGRDKGLYEYRLGEVGCELLSTAYGVALDVGGVDTVRGDAAL